MCRKMEKLHSIAQYFLLTTAKLNEYSTQHLSITVCNFLDSFVTRRPDRFIFPVSLLINTNTKRKKKKKQGCWSNCAWLWLTLTASDWLWLVHTRMHFTRPAVKSKPRKTVSVTTSSVSANKRHWFTVNSPPPPPPKKKQNKKLKTLRVGTGSVAANHHTKPWQSWGRGGRTYTK